MSKPTKIALIRQRPAFGDALLLGPLINAIKSKHLNSCLTVITDATYMLGALPLVFDHINGVDRIECINSIEWTTEDNRAIDPALRASGTEVPYTVKTADIVIDCNSYFIEFERQHHGAAPYGIAEFWLKFHKYYEPGMDLLPHFKVTDNSRKEVMQWMHEKAIKTPMVGIVLRAGDPIRDWDFGGLSTQLVDWLHTTGYTAIGIDPLKPLPSVYGHSCIGKKLDFVAALLEQCKLVITPDTGMLHLSQAVGTGTLALWGIMPPELRMRGYNCKVIPENSLGYCEDGKPDCQLNCKAQRWSCLKRITLPMIIKGLKESL